ncbi:MULTISPECIES: asparagine synthase-related protein [Halomonas]|uniref:asparagine synthase (glutamine-hydrolyzing) n=1 Tax=Halomonas ventosae TaxID=229007 RepID=A0A4R6I3T4_9GAMM|nr:asparagine synthase-related protein [Halomonas ventosae]TDO16653.1 asparagine synthase (glutamine-hydrolysing) [Halomonas ventosae]
MSAIFGFVSFSNAMLPRASFDAAFATLDSWGKDGRGVLQMKNAMLGHQKLALREVHSDLTSENKPDDVQPYAKGELCIVADALIDNREDLCRRLDISNTEGSRVSDSQLILAAFLWWGEECPGYLLGDFAFAIWNSRDGTLFAARDVAGARPFFYAEHNTHILFSTTVEAIVTTPGIDFDVDEFRVAFFLAQPLRANENPFIKGVKFLPPGHWLSASRNGTKVNRYWFPEAIEQAAPASLEEYAERLRELLEQAVADRLSLNHPVGSHISGGLDSTGITVLAHRALRQHGGKLDRAYTWAPPINDEFPLHPQGFDERTEIDALAKREGFDVTFGSATAINYLQFFKRNLALENSADLFEELPLMQEAMSRGTRVMLSGWGADECVTFGLRSYPSWLLSHRRFKDLFNMARAMGGGLRHPFGVAKFLFQDAMLPFLPECVNSTFSPYLNMEKLQCMGHPDFMKQHPDARIDISLTSRNAKDPRSMQCALLNNGHIAARMSLWSTWAGPLGIQYRYPFMDKRLLEFSLSLPPDMLWQKRRGRIVYRTAMADVLPKRVSKYDVANETKCKKIRFDCWNMLKDHHDEYVGIDCPWLDMKALSRKIRDAPSSLEDFDLLSFIPLHSSMRVLELWHRSFHGKIIRS